VQHLLVRPQVLERFSTAAFEMPRWFSASSAVSTFASRM
jgi:hypothetical protein